MSNTYETDYGEAKAEWLDEPQKWVVRLYPNSIEDRRPLYKSVARILHRDGWTTSILQQRKNQLRFTAWRDESVPARQL